MSLYHCHLLLGRYQVTAAANRSISLSPSPVSSKTLAAFSGSRPLLPVSLQCDPRQDIQSLIHDSNSGVTLLVFIGSNASVVALTPELHLTPSDYSLSWIVIVIVDLTCEIIAPPTKPPRREFLY